jgi:hypothetical protein
LDSQQPQTHPSKALKQHEDVNTDKLFPGMSNFNRVNIKCSLIIKMNFAGPCLPVLLILQHAILLSVHPWATQSISN